MKTKVQARPSLELAQLLTAARQLPLGDQIRLIEGVAPEIKRQLTQSGVEFGPLRAEALAHLTQAIQALQNPTATPKRSLWGLCAGLGKSPSADEIDTARAEVWANFPRNDY